MGERDDVLSADLNAADVADEDAVQPAYRANWARIGVALLVALSLLSSCGSAGDDADAASDNTGAAIDDSSALVDWNGRHHDVGEASNPRAVDDGYVVDWDRYGLHTTDSAGELRDPDAFSRDPVEPRDYIVDLTDFPFTNESNDLRELTVTNAARAYRVVDEKLRCRDDNRPDPGPPWETVDLDDWVESLPGIALLTFDAFGRVVQIRPVAGC